MNVTRHVIESRLARRGPRRSPHDRQQLRVGNVGSVRSAVYGRRHVAIASQVGDSVGRQPYFVIAILDAGRDGAAVLDSMVTGRCNPHAPSSAGLYFSERARRGVGDPHVGRRKADNLFAECEGRHEGAAVRGRHAVRC